MAIIVSYWAGHINMASRTDDIVIPISVPHSIDDVAFIKDTIRERLISEMPETAIGKSPFRIVILYILRLDA